jgi:hypothetical protein
MTDQPTEPEPQPEPAPEPEPAEPVEDIPSSSETSGQFPADEVEQTHEQ